jgi:outer membrane protein 64
MRKHFSLLPLAMLVTTAVYAENLEIINVVSENTGAKSKTNVITTESINRSTETELKGLLKTNRRLTSVVVAEHHNGLLFAGWGKIKWM